MKKDTYPLLLDKIKRDEIIKLNNCNEYTKKYGLSLSNEEILNIIEKKIDTLKNNDRIEFRNSIIDKLIYQFCDSPYISQYNYVETLYELIDIFYLYKNETMDLISDDELIDFMKNSFNGICEGSLDYLAGTVMYKMREHLLEGKHIEGEE